MWVDVQCTNMCEFVFWLVYYFMHGIGILCWWNNITLPCFMVAYCIYYLQSLKIWTNKIEHEGCFNKYNTVQNRYYSQYLPIIVLWYVCWTHGNGGLVSSNVITLKQFALTALGSLTKKFLFSILRRTMNQNKSAICLANLAMFQYFL